jgi:hypothetical protein
MSNAKRLLTALLAGGSIAMLAHPVSAAPAAPGVALQQLAPSSVEHVRWWGRGGCWGCGIGAGFVAGAIVGGALAAPYYYGPGYYGGGPYYYGGGPYYPAPAYGPGPAPGYGPAPAYYSGPAPGPGGDASAYCAQRFHSYDPRTGTYLGTDGARHPCP